MASRFLNEFSLSGFVRSGAEQSSPKAPLKFALAENSTDGGPEYLIVCWPNEVEGLYELRVGDYVEVHGKLHQRNFTTAQGQQRSHLELVAKALKAQPLTPRSYSTVEKGLEITDADIRW